MSDYQFKCDKCSYATDNEESLSQHQSMHSSNHSGGFGSRFKALGARF